jgi:hypothetical protein
LFCLLRAQSHLCVRLVHDTECCRCDFVTNVPSIRYELAVQVPPDRPFCLATTQVHGFARASRLGLLDVGCRRRFRSNTKVVIVVSTRQGKVKKTIAASSQCTTSLTPRKRTKWEGACVMTVEEREQTKRVTTSRVGVYASCKFADRDHLNLEPKACSVARPRLPWRLGG